MRLSLEPRDARRRADRLWLSAASAVLLALAAAWAFSGWDPPGLTCLFHRLTGQPCPTCGAGRSLRALLTGDVLVSLRMNPLVGLAYLAWIAVAAEGLLAQWPGWPRVALALTAGETRALRWAIPAVILINWIWLIADGR